MTQPPPTLGVKGHGGLCNLCLRPQVQQFKQDPRPTTCLHSIFHVRTGDELLSCEEYGHLQVGGSPGPLRAPSTQRAFRAIYTFYRFHKLFKLAGGKRP